VTGSLCGFPRESEIFFPFESVIAIFQTMSWTQTDHTSTAAGVLCATHFWPLCGKEFLLYFFSLYVTLVDLNAAAALKLGCPILLFYCPLTGFATGNGLKPVTVYLLQ
jgi:hypothetical protein